LWNWDGYGVKCFGTDPSTPGLSNVVSDGDVALLDI